MAYILSYSCLGCFMHNAGVLLQMQVSNFGLSTPF